MFVQGFAYGRGRATTALELITPLSMRAARGRKAGHEVDVFVPSRRFVKDTPGNVHVSTVGDFDGVKQYDVVLYNSGLGEATLDRVRRIQAPKLMMQHSYDHNDPGLKMADSVWYPSKACARGDRGTHDKFVVPPPINPALYATTPGRKIGLCLSSHWKGGLIVAEMAKALPRRRFLVVRDGRGNGVGLFKGLKNVDLVDFMDPRDFYSECRVQVLPSRSESYGRVAVEGSVSGIPFVGSRCPGIMEAMGGHGIFLPRGDVRRWVATVDQLMGDRREWKKASIDMKARASKIDYRGDQARFCRRVEALARG